MTVAEFDREDSPGLHPSIMQLQHDLKLDLEQAEDIFRISRLKEAQNGGVRQIRMFANFFGVSLAGLILQIRPDILRLPLDRLRDRSIILERNGCEKYDAKLMLALCPDLASPEDRDFEASYVEIRTIFPEQKTRQRFLAFHPEILRVSVHHLRQAASSTEDSLEMRLEKTLTGRHTPAIQRAKTVNIVAHLLMTKILELDPRAEDAGKVARRFVFAFQEYALQAYQLFLDQSWTPNDIAHLAEQVQNRAWCKTPERLLASERELFLAGIPIAEARTMVKLSNQYTTHDTALIRPAVRALRDLKIPNTALFETLYRTPRAIFQTPERIREWHTEMLARQWKPWEHLAMLFRAPRQQRAEPEPAAQTE